MIQAGAAAYSTRKQELPGKAAMHCDLTGVGLDWQSIVNSAACMRSFYRPLTDTCLTPEPADFHQLPTKRLRMESPWKYQHRFPWLCTETATMHSVASLFAGDRTCLN